MFDFLFKNKSNNSIILEEIKYNELLLELQKRAIDKNEFEYNGDKIIFNNKDLGYLIFSSYIRHERKTQKVIIKGKYYYVDNYLLLLLERNRNATEKDFNIKEYAFNKFRGDAVPLIKKEYYEYKKYLKNKYIELYNNLLKYK